MIEQEVNHNSLSTRTLSISYKDVHWNIRCSKSNHKLYSAQPKLQYHPWWLPCGFFERQEERPWGFLFFYLRDVKEYPDP